MMQTRLLASALTLMLLCGCVQIPSTPSTEPTPAPPSPVAPSGPKVQTDWSKLDLSDGDTIHSDRDAGRWYEDYTTDLIPRSDYGPLYPYVGSLVQRIDRWTDSQGQEQLWIDEFPSPVYGLMTRDGKIVTDPAYQGVYQPIYRHGSSVVSYPLLLLTKADSTWNSDDITTGARYAVAAKDGSWCTDFEFWQCYAMNGKDIMLFGPSGLTCLTPATGERQDWMWNSLGFSDADISLLMGDLFWLYGPHWYEEGVFLGLIGEVGTDHDVQARLFHPEDGSISTISLQKWETLLDKDLRSDWNTRDTWNFILENGQITLTYADEQHTFPAPDGMDMLHSVQINDDLAILSDYSHSEGRTWLYHLSGHTLLAHANYIGFIQDTYSLDAPAFVHVMYNNGSQALYGPNFVPFLSYPIPHPPTQVTFQYRDGLIFARDDLSFFSCYDSETGSCVFYRNLNMGD